MTRICNLSTGALRFFAWHMPAALTAVCPQKMYVRTTSEKRGAHRRFSVVYALDVIGRPAVGARMACHRSTDLIGLAGIAAQRDADAHAEIVRRAYLDTTRAIAEAWLDEVPECGRINACPTCDERAVSGQSLKENALLPPRGIDIVFRLAAYLARWAPPPRSFKTIGAPHFSHVSLCWIKNFLTAGFAAQGTRIEVASLPPVIKVGSFNEEPDAVDVRHIARACLLPVSDSGHLETGMICNITHTGLRRIDAGLGLFLVKTGQQGTPEQWSPRPRVSFLRSIVCDWPRSRDWVGWAPRH